MKNPEIAHISSARPSSRRIGATLPTRTTWCGAAPTAADVTPEQARTWVASAWTQGPAKCPACFGRLIARAEHNHNLEPEPGRDTGRYSGGYRTFRDGSCWEDFGADR